MRPTYRVARGFGRGGIQLAGTPRRDQARSSARFAEGGRVRRTSSSVDRVEAAGGSEAPVTLWAAGLSYQGLMDRPVSASEICHRLRIASGLPRRKTGSRTAGPNVEKRGP